MKNVFRLRCKDCKVNRPMPSGLTNWNNSWFTDAAGEIVRCECGKALRPFVVEAKHSDKTECGARCTSAIGPACECNCDGENHGIGAAA